MVSESELMCVICKCKRSDATYLRRSLRPFRCTHTNIVMQSMHMQDYHTEIVPIAQKYHAVYANTIKECEQKQ